MREIVLRDDLLAKRRQTSFFRFPLFQLSNHPTWHYDDKTIVHVLSGLGYGNTGDIPIFPGINYHY